MSNTHFATKFCWRNWIPWKLVANAGFIFHKNAMGEELKTNETSVSLTSLYKPAVRLFEMWLLTKQRKQIVRTEQSGVTTSENWTLHSNRPPVEMIYSMVLYFLLVFRDFLSKNWVFHVVGIGCCYVIHWFENNFKTKGNSLVFLWATSFNNRFSRVFV